MVFSLAFLLLIYYFVSSDISIYYVWEHTSTELPLMYKLSGVWAGKQGSLLLWSWAILLSLAIEEFIQSRKERKEEDEEFEQELKLSKARRKLREKMKEKVVLFDYVRFFALVFALIFLIVLLIDDPFKLTPDKRLSAKPNGNGLNPLLQTPLMAVHPPTTFLGYAFTTLPLACAFAYLITDKKGWTKISLQWTRLAWLFLTLGVGIGALWAYIVPGWGEYWAWDPVETASLIPWITLTGFMHAQNDYKKKGSYQIVAPLLAIISFVLVVLATFVTRASGLWISVHAFGSADVNKIGTQRLFELIGTNNDILAYFLMMVGVLVIGGFLIIRKWSKMEYAEEGEEKKFLDYFSNKNFMLITVIIFAIITIITSILLFQGIDRKVEPEEFDNKVGIFIVALIVVMGVCLVLKYMEKTSAVFLILLMLIGGGAGAVIYPQKEIGFSVPIFAIACITSIYRIAMGLRKGSLRAKIKSSSVHLIHFAVALLLIGYVVSQNLTAEQQFTMKYGNTIKIKDYEIKFSKYTESSTHFIAYFDVSKDGKFLTTAKPGFININNQWRTEIDVKTIGIEDVYLIIDKVNDDGSLVLTVKILPMVFLLWIGMTLMSIGIILRIVVDYLPKKEEEREDFETKEKIKERYEEKEEKDYEKLLEEELKELK